MREIHSTAFLKYLTTKSYLPLPLPRYLLSPLFQAKYFARHSLDFTDENVVNLYILPARGLIPGKSRVCLKFHSHHQQNYPQNLGLLFSPHCTILYLYIIPDQHSARVLRSKDMELGVRSQEFYLVSITSQLCLSA